VKIFNTFSVSLPTNIDTTAVSTTMFSGGRCPVVTKGTSQGKGN